MVGDVICRARLLKQGFALHGQLYHTFTCANALANPTLTHGEANL